jgi:hypothetical protein
MMSVINFQQIPELIEIIQPGETTHSDLFHIIRLDDHFHSMKKEMGPYRQNFFEISFTESLNSVCTIGDRRFQQENDSLLFVSPGQINSWNVKNSDNSVRGYMVYFKPELLGAGELSCEVFQYVQVFQPQLHAGLLPET